MLEKTETVIIGIDPGTRLMGHSVVRTDGNHFDCLEMDVLDMRKEKDPLRRLELVLEEVLRVIAEYKPGSLSIESPFYGKNVQALLKLGRAQGVAIAAAMSQGLEVHEYSPREIKQSLTGKGSASKEQVCAMAMRIANIHEAPPKYLDATDALAAAICHGIHSRFETIRGKAALPNRKMERPHAPAKKTPWAEFIAENPDRIK